MSKSAAQRTPSKRNNALWIATQQKLRWQAALGVFGTAFFGFWLLFVQPWIWLYYVGVMAFAGAVLAFGARRGIAYPLHRALSAAMGFGLFGVGWMYLTHDSLRSEPLVAVYLAYAAIILVGAVVYFLMWDVPHWRDTYESNLRRKIDVTRGLFSVTVEWARRKPLPPGFRSRVVYTGATTGGIVVAPIIWLVIWLFGAPGVLFPGALFLWFGVITCVTELYNVYQMQKIERMIKKPLIIEVYANEYGR